MDSTWRFEPSASDPDGDAMQFFVENAPPWTEFDPATGVLEGTPGEGDLGVYEDVLISVTDGLATVGLPPFSIEVLPNGSPTGSATLSWTPPTERVDGAPIGALAGYRVLYGRGSGKYDRAAEIDNPGVTRYVVENLGPGSWFFAVTAGPWRPRERAVGGGLPVLSPGVLRFRPWFQRESRNRSRIRCPECRLVHVLRAQEI